MVVDDFFMTLGNIKMMCPRSRVLRPGANAPWLGVVVVRGFSGFRLEDT